MVTPLPIDPDNIAVASAASRVAPSDLATALTTVQAAATASYEHVAAVEAVSQQEQAAMAAAATTTSGAATAPANLVAALAALQAQAAAAALELQLAAPPPHAATVATPAVGQAAPVAGVFETSSVNYLHAQAVGIQDIRTLVPVVLGVTSTQYPRWRDLVLLTLQRYALDNHVSSDAPTLDGPHWRQMDNMVLSWLLGTITAAAQQLWVALEEQFLGDREARVLHLDT
jgi:hypothetical protein